MMWSFSMRMAGDLVEGDRMTHEIALSADDD